MSPAVERVEAAIREFAFFTPHCWPSEKTIAKRARCDRRTVVRAKAELGRRGVITWKRQRRAGARWEHCVYTIHDEWHPPHRRTVLAWLDRRHRTRPCLTKRTATTHRRNDGAFRASSTPVQTPTKTPAEGQSGPPRLPPSMIERRRRVHGRRCVCEACFWAVLT